MTDSQHQRPRHTPSTRSHGQRRISGLTTSMALGSLVLTGAASAVLVAGNVSASTTPASTTPATSTAKAKVVATKSTTTTRVKSTTKVSSGSGGTTHASSGGS